MTTNKSDLGPEKVTMFMEIVEVSLRVTRRDQLFSWLQGSFQYLFPHEVMICGISASAGEDFSFESFSSIRYPESCIRAATSMGDGVVWRIMSLWQNAHRPVMLGGGLPPGDYGSYLVPFADEEVNLMEVELHNIVAHGMAGQNGGMSTFFCFSRVLQPPSKAQARLLELLMPYLHSAVVRVAGHSDGARVQRGAITGRECEVLKLLKTGKTNWEIASILGISPNTVKNHVRSILRKLNAQNRSHAAVKANNFLEAKNS
ncbi:MAG: LuxR C-terminal-related transcriptional regulator [Gallionellaceae bacterium]|nr:LuxR C-terminal-related transcriptional regulator [Gallionellaceae bacterium]